LVNKRSFFEGINISKAVEKLQGYAHEHGVEQTTLDWVMTKNRYILDRAADLLELKQLEGYVLLIPFTEDEILITDNLLTIINDLEGSLKLFPYAHIIGVMLEGKKLLTSIRQHDIVGLKGNISHVLRNTVDSVKLVNHHASTMAAV